MKRLILFLLLSVMITLSSATSLAYKSGKLCTSDSTHEDTYCRCLFIHPKWEFCKEGPLPSCCLATEKGTKITACGCCPHRVVNPNNRGVYQHIQEETEYAQ